MSALSSTATVRRPGNRSRATAAPSGRPTRLAIATAVTLTRNDSSTISTRPGSRVAINPNAAAKAWAMSDIPGDDGPNVCRIATPGAAFVQARVATACTPAGRAAYLRHGGHAAETRPRRCASHAPRAWARPGWQDDRDGRRRRAAAHPVPQRAGGRHHDDDRRLPGLSGRRLSPEPEHAAAGRRDHRYRP